MKPEGLWTAVRFLTRLPAPGSDPGPRHQPAAGPPPVLATWPEAGSGTPPGSQAGRAAGDRTGDAGRLGGAAPWFPLAGALVGAVAALASSLCALLWPAPVPAAVAVAAGLWASGGLHLDGLMDTVDGLASGAPPERARAIMRDSRVGALGAAAGALALLLRFALVAALPPGDNWRGLIAAAAIARWAVVCAAAREVPCAGGRGNAWRRASDAQPGDNAPGQTPGTRGGAAGLGAGFAAALGRRAWIGALALALAVSSAATGPLGLGATTAATLVALGAGGWLRGRLGALTGDGLGAVAEWAEWAALAVFAARTGVAARW